MADTVDRIRQAVVKVFTQSDAPDYDQPWQTEGVVSSAGSGLVVSTARGPRVLTNAHVVENQVFIEVRRYGKPTKYVAEVEGAGHDCDLALLTVEGNGFFRGATPIPIGELPMLGNHVTVLGYPIGGDRLSLTQGIVSRIEMAQYAHSQRRLLSVQIDAAINAGNSGGPVVGDDGRLVGVAFQALDEGENIGYVIGSPVVRRFLSDLDDGTFDGFPDIGIVTQPLGSQSHRGALGLPARLHGGLLVADVVYGGSAWRCLRRGDVLLKIGRSPVASDGTVNFRKGERIHYSHVVAQRQMGQSLTVEFWRGGKARQCDIRLKPPRRLVPEDRYDVKPTYFVHAGLLFVPLTRDYLKTWGSEWWSSAPAKLQSIYENQIRTSTRREVVLLQKVLADRVNQGYHEMESQVVVRVQGKRIRRLSELIRIVGAAKARFLRFDFDDRTSIVLDRSLAAQRHEAILKRFGIPHDRSEDLRKMRQ
ncbi:MAG: serine protease [Acidobacteriota bacterium]|nr:serine protease [Acidobacteriota bacterium]